MEVPKKNRQLAPTYINGSNAEDIVRPTADFSPSVWGDYFISHSPEYSSLTAQKASAWTEQRLEELKKEVKAMFRTDDLGTSLSLIDDLQRLGLSYHFEEEISEALRSIHYHNSEIEDLHLVALRFRLLRQQGYNASSDVFSKFKDDEGKFKQELSGDVKGLLHLYEATWLGTHEDEILDEAQEFARGYMQRKLENAEDEYSTQLRHALDVPLRRRVRRLQAREYISMYENEIKNNNLFLLELAKLDFNRLQLLHQAEIKIISMWWKELGLAKKLSFIKDRVPESYFWILGISFEPQYSCGRILLAKLIVMWTVLDDMYDAYGTLEELQLFTDLISRWDLHDVHRLPGYMRMFLTCFTSFIREIEESTLKGSVHHIHYIIEMFKDITAAYFKEAKWANKRFTPTLQEYLRNGLVSGGLPMTCFVLCLVGEATQDTLDWVLSMPKIVEAFAIIGRLLNDISTTKFEQERMHVASALQCYMNDTGATELGATSKLKEMVVNGWKDINRQSLNTLHSRKHVDELALSCAQVTEFLYRHEDIFTNPAGKMKETIALLLVNPIQD